jgi:adhesin/invasin
MGLKLVRLAILSALAMGGLGTLAAQSGSLPMLRLVSATVGPVSIVPGANGINQTVEAYNAGAGTLSLSVSSSVAWITPSVGAPRACTTTTAATSCVPLIFGLNTTTLAASATAYTGIVTVTAPNTVDAPQTITVTVEIGGAVPSSVNAYVTPYVAPPAAASTVGIPFTLGTASCPYLNGCLTGAITTQDGANWLSLTLSGAGSNQSTLPYMINITPQPSNTAGNTYTGSIVTSGSAFAPDNKTIAVTMNIATLPIVETPAPINLQVIAGSTTASYVLLGNLGQGTLAISSVTASGTGITAANSGTISNGSGGSVPAVTVTINSTGLSPGPHTGSVTVVTNAANSPTVIPVTFQVLAVGPPLIFYQGVVDDAVFGQDGLTVTPGDVIALFGQQLDAISDVGPLPPLQTSLGAATGVTVNGEAAPLYYASPGQINFQMPMDTPLGTALVQVGTEVFYSEPLSEGPETSNMVSVQVAARAPRLLLLYNTGGYGAIVDASQGNGNNTLPMPSTVSEPNFITQPAATGDILVIYAIGLGPTSPSVATGLPAPDGSAGHPLAQLTSTPTVVFDVDNDGLQVQISVPPAQIQYAGLSPYFAGLYQVNVPIPQSCPPGTVQVSLTFPDGTASNAVNIAVQ